MRQLNEIVIGGETLDVILAAHKRWVDGEGGERAVLRNANLRNADLRNADLRDADLSYADLRNADLSYADLSYADLSYADLDYSAWPLWCGSFNVRCDRKLLIQLAGHVAALRVEGATPADLRLQKMLRACAKDWQHKPDEWPDWKAVKPTAKKRRSQ